MFPDDVHTRLGEATLKRMAAAERAIKRNHKMALAGTKAQVQQERELRSAIRDLHELAKENRALILEIGKRERETRDMALLLTEALRESKAVHQRVTAVLERLLGPLEADDAK